MLPYQDKEKSASPFVFSAHSGVVLLLFRPIYCSVKENSQNLAVIFCLALSSLIHSNLHSDYIFTHTV